MRRGERKLTMRPIQPRLSPTPSGNHPFVPPHRDIVEPRAIEEAVVLGRSGVDLRLELTETRLCMREWRAEAARVSTTDMLMTLAGGVSVVGRRGVPGTNESGVRNGSASGRRSSWMSMSVRVLSMRKRGFGGASWRGWAGSGAELSDEDATEDAVDGGDGILRGSWEGTSLRGDVRD